MARWVMEVIDGNLLNEDGHAMLGAEPVRYVQDYDLHFARGTGWVDFTDDPDKAICWPSVAELLEAYSQVPERFPTRADGKPNRPLRALTITPVDLDAQDRRTPDPGA